VGNAVGHSIAAMVERVRAGGLGLVHGNGGQGTKQSFALYSTQPPDAFARIDVQPEVDLDPRAVLAPDWAGPVTVDAATLVYDRDGPSHVLAGVLDGSGARGWAASRDAELFDELTQEGLAGRTGRRTSEGDVEL